MVSKGMVMALSLISLLANFVHSKECRSMSFSNKISFVNCIDLPTFNAVLHWTYDGPKSTISMAFSVPSSNDGWIAWALNPTGIGMVGSQALVGFHQKPTGAIVVETLDIKSYHSILPGPISYNVTGLSGELTSNKITIFGSWVIPGEPIVNTVWQVGSVSDGKSNVHAMQPDNFNSKKQINLATAIASIHEPVMAPWSIEEANKNEATIKSVVSIFFVLGGLLVSLF